MSYSTIFPNTRSNLQVNFNPINNDWENQELVIKEWVALQAGTLLAREIVSNVTTGKLVAASAEATTGKNYVGILMEEIASTDADYSTSGKTKLVSVPTSIKAICEYRVHSWTASAAKVWSTVEIADSGKWLAVDTLWLGATITKHVSSTRGECQINFTALSDTA